MPSIKRDFAYNLILTVGNYIFLLLTYPYVSRVLDGWHVLKVDEVGNVINILSSRH